MLGGGGIASLVGISPARACVEIKHAIANEITKRFMGVLLRTGMQGFLHQNRIEQYPKLLASGWRDH